MAAGEWELIIWAEHENRPLIRKSIQVVEPADFDSRKKPPMPLHAAKPKLCFEGSNSIEVGHVSKNGTFIKLDRFHPDMECVTVHVTWDACSTARPVVFDFKDPSGEHYIQPDRGEDVTIGPDWISSWYYFYPNMPQKKSRWVITVWDQNYPSGSGALLAQTSYLVSPSASSTLGSPYREWKRGMGYGVLYGQTAKIGAGSDRG